MTPVAYDEIHDCDECLAVNGQKMFKISGRDFVEIKKKILELDDYIDYQLNIMRAEGDF